MFSTKVENNHRKCNGFAPLFLGVVADSNFVKTKLPNKWKRAGK